MEYQIQASTMFGIEAITANELRDLGYEDLTVENGKVTFTGDEMDIAICNVHLRTAERVLIKVAEFEAKTFDELFDKTKEVEWGEYIPIHGKMHVVGKSSKSTLFSVSDCQAIVKKAVIEGMKRKYHKNEYPENGPVYKIEVAILKDKVTLTIDTTGEGLHKRGYREYAGGAPLKETLACAMILLSRWKPDRTLVDLFTGSGTIPIEAAMIARNMAPGMNRSFVSETWPQFKNGEYKQVKDGAQHAAKYDVPVRILASDIDGHILKTARPNAVKAGVDDCIEFHTMDAKDFSTKKLTGTIICNPPYGERMGEIEEIRKIYKNLGKIAEKNPYWNMFIITSYEDFEECFGEKATKNRKLYNGQLKCYLYEYIRKFTDKERAEVDKKKEQVKEEKEIIKKAKEVKQKQAEAKKTDPFAKFIKKGRR